MLDGAPTKEHRLAEYFLVISYGDELKVRVPSPSLEIFENHEKRKNELKEYLKQQFLQRKQKKMGGKGHEKNKKTPLKKTTTKSGLDIQLVNKGNNQKEKISDNNNNNNTNNNTNNNNNSNNNNNINNNNNNNNNNTNNNNNNSNNTHGKSQSVTISSTQSTATYTANSEVADHTTTTSSTTATQASPWLPNQNQGSGNDIKILKPRDQNSNSLQQINLQYSTRQTSQTAEVESSNEDEESDELERMIRASEKQTYDGIYGPSDSEFVSSHDKKQSVTSGVSETLPEEKETEFHEENNIKTKETVAATPTSATSTPTTTATASTASAPASRPSVILEEDSKQEQDTVVNRDSIDGEKDKKSKTLPGFNMKGLTQGFSKIKDKIQESTFKTTTNTKKPNKNLGMCVILSLSLYNIFFFLRNVYIIFFFLRREAVCMYVVVCCQDNNPFVNFRFEPKIIDRFPFLDHADTEIVTTGSQLQYFCLPTGLFLTRFPSLPIFFTFVWTPASGDRIFGACLRFFEPVPIHVVKVDFFFFFFIFCEYDFQGLSPPQPTEDLAKYPLFEWLAKAPKLIAMCAKLIDLGVPLCAVISCVQMPSDKYKSVLEPYRQYIVEHFGDKNWYASALIQLPALMKQIEDVKLVWREHDDDVDNK
ncbi:hypothetical protein RFI_16484 [Reticulomyxa filosa]|uniref:uDENN domain-containing protein n=1 Tax=Reticulomyxa filosa TaxID=46433 RepID=X6N494_RETFI|nr:hypothetical protein RFI_16484 [Reticulomyxa filosa]|eukprot:ETO20733.1 hypothetical protein RFI_16484 [Reticulomyxa filosa]